MRDPFLQKVVSLGRERMFKLFHPDPLDLVPLIFKIRNIVDLVAGFDHRLEIFLRLDISRAQVRRQRANTAGNVLA